jgi:hypothetical protein
VWTRAEANAAAWLGQHSSAGDVVLASTEFANPLAGSIDGRVVQGHNVATLRNSEKEQLVRAFFDAATSTDQRQHLLELSQATVVALGPHERAGGVDSLDDQRNLRLVYDQQGVKLYRVER